MLAPDDPHALFEIGQYKRAVVALDRLSSRRELLTDEQILRAELLSITDSVDSALQLAEKLLSLPTLSVPQRCRLRDVLGTCSFRKLLYSKGLEHYTRGIELAESGGHLKSECVLRVRLLRNQVRHHGGYQATTNLGVVRRKTYQLADQAVSLEFQIVLTELAAKLGLYPRAHHHLRAAKSLSAMVANRGLQAEVMGAELGLAGYESNLSDALELAFQLRSLAEETGSQSAKAAASNNLGHLLSAHSRFDEAIVLLQETLEDTLLKGRTGIVQRDTLMYLLMSTDRDQEARLQAEAISELIKQPAVRDSYYGLWYLETRVKWLYRTGQTNAGLALAMESLPRIERMADPNLLERMKLLAAEGLGRCGKPAQGARLMAEAVNSNPDPPLEIVAEASRVAGRLAAQDDHAAALGHFERAGRILQSVGNLTAHAEVQRDALETIISTDGRPMLSASDAGLLPLAATEGSRSWRPPDLRPPAASMAERIAALVDLAAHPQLLATETLSLIADTDAVLQATIVETRPDGSRAELASLSASGPGLEIAAHPDAVRINIGHHRDRDYVIIAVPRPSATARATLLAVEHLVQTSLALARARYQEREQAALWPEHTPEQQLGLVCSSEKMLDLIKTIRRVAASNITVLITGETGVGKELFARALHQASARHDRTFLPFNCTTVPKDMIDSQLFGYKRGAFTGAHDDFPGLIRAAAGGTLFLDEIGEMSPEAQPKLLRFLESGEILPLGESRPHLVDVRVVAATNANLDQLVTEGRFREDLYYRLNVIPLRVPPLRERREEIPALVEYFLERHCLEFQKPLMRVAEETLEYLVLHKWPGNVRQLSNELRRMVALAEPGAVLMPEHLSTEIATSRRTIPADQRQLRPTEVVVRIDQPMAAAAEHLERALIKRALAMCEGNGVEAAKMLGLSRKGLYLKRQRFDL
ncbi:MAG: sigma-54 dependent transcriptional regulator [Acidobacteriota bacterium]|nr:sigma-54 dependent transcriptional regulator [Acidobacteriota bacterium]